jgi:SAM-dependent methyltransferase
MRLRVVLGHFLVRLGRFIQSLAPMIMRPGDLVEFSRQCYASSKELEHFSSDKLLRQGLNSLETSLLEKIPISQGRLLLLGLGGGRDAIPLARLGFEVTGVDFVPEMVRRAEENAAREGVKIQGLVGEISTLDLPLGSFDVVWLSQSMYSLVPTRQRRVAMLRRLRNILKPGGYLICMFHWEKGVGFSPKVEMARKIFSVLTWGNLWYEPGDMLWHNVEFVHAFASEEELRSEFEAGGFSLLHLQLPDEGVEGGALLTVAGE